MNRRSFLAAGAAVVGTAIAGCVGRDQQYDVAMVSDAFVPGAPVKNLADAPAWVPDVPTVEVKVDQTVTWLNTGSRVHTVTAATREHPEVERMLGAPEDEENHGVPRLPKGARFFASGGFTDEISAVESFHDELNGGGAIAPGETYRTSFHVPGWYHYYCIPHEPAGMMGNVHVLP